MADSGGRRSVVESTTPIWARHASGLEAPVDLSLVASGGGFSPRNSAAPVSLPAFAGDGLTFTDVGVAIAPVAPSRGARAQQVDGGLLYANVDTDTDFAVSPQSNGVETFSQLRSAASPETIAYRLSLPAGAVASLTPGGGVEVMRGGREFVAIAPPAALDAGGAPVPTSYSLDGDLLTIAVSHRGRDVQYPITVDPYIVETMNFIDPNQEFNNFDGWYWTQRTTAGNTGIGYTEMGPAGRGLYAYANPGWTVAPWDYGEWAWNAIQDTSMFEAQTYMSMVPFYGYFQMGRQIYGSTGYPAGSPRIESGNIPLGWVTQCGTGGANGSGGCNESSTPTNNQFSFYFQSAGYQVTVGANTYAYLQQAYLYLNDSFTPTVSSVDSWESSGHWRQDNVQAQPFQVYAADRGLGMKAIDVTGPGVNLEIKPECTGQRDWSCPLSAPNANYIWNPSSFTYNTSSLPEGIDTLEATATDIADNTTTTPYAWSVKVDKTPPWTDISGELETASNEPRLTTESPNLDVAATDDNDAGTATSGVQSIKVQIDGAGPTATNPYITSAPEAGEPPNVWAQPNSSCDSCSLEHNFTFNTTGLADGTHTIDVITTDYAHNSSDRSWTITIDRTSAKPYCSDPSADPAGCQSDQPSTTAASCTPYVPTASGAGGTIDTSGAAVATTQQTMPSALAVSDSVTLEGLGVAPALNSPALPALTGYASLKTLMPATVGGSAPTYSVGSGVDAACVSPQWLMTGSQPPTLVNGTALEYADTAPSTDTIVRPVPLGVQEISQIRDASAPEADTYQVALQPGQYLQQLSDGSIAIIDPTIPSISASAPPGASGTPDPSLTDGDTSDEVGPGYESDGSDDPSQYTASALAGLTPDDPYVLPSQTQSHYDNENTHIWSADDDADGQEVGVVTAPYAHDTSGTAVPVTMAIAGPNTFTVTTAHREASYTYPVMTSHETTATTARRRQHVKWQVDGQQPTLGFHWTQDNTGQGTQNFIKARHIQNSRYIMYYHDSCDGWDGGDGNRANAGANLDPPSSLPSGASHSPLWDIVNPTFGTPAYRCQQAVDYVIQAQKLNLVPQISLEPHTAALSGAGIKPHAYARSAWRLMEAAPFTAVHTWGVMNEPDCCKTSVGPDTAARVWRAVYSAARTKDDADGGAVPCPRCEIVAGEFHDARPNADSYVKTYIADLKKSGAFWWALHDYGDVTYQDFVPNETSYIHLGTFEVDLDKGLGSKRERILVDEAGVVMARGGLPTSINAASGTSAKQAVADQQTDAKRFAKLQSHDHSRQLVLVAYYELFGNSNSWDSALVAPPGPPAAGSSDPGGGKRMRPAYCRLALQTDTYCDVVDGT